MRRKFSKSRGKFDQLQHFFFFFNVQVSTQLILTESGVSKLRTHTKKFVFSYSHTRACSVVSKNDTGCFKHFSWVSFLKETLHETLKTDSERVIMEWKANLLQHMMNLFGTFWEWKKKVEPPCMKKKCGNLQQFRMPLAFLPVALLVVTVEPRLSTLSPWSTLRDTRSLATRPPKNLQTE